MKTEVISKTLNRASFIKGTVTHCATSSTIYEYNTPTVAAGILQLITVVTLTSSFFSFSLFLDIPQLSRYINTFTDKR